MPNPYPVGHGLNSETLKNKQRELREAFPEALGLRVHRALSWLKRAEAETDDHDVKFVLLWIGFNAAYAGDLDQATSGSSQGERDRFNDFFEFLVRLDADQRIYSVIWERFGQEIRMLLNNQFVFAPFWKFQSGEFGGAGWEISFESAKRTANQALAETNTTLVLSILFDRLYVLRNQLVHGGATWNSSANRAQVHDGAAILANLLPVFIDIMMDHPKEEWIAPLYPLVSTK